MSFDYRFAAPFRSGCDERASLLAKLFNVKQRDPLTLDAVDDATRHGFIAVPPGRGEK